MSRPILPPFTAENFQTLSENEHRRFVPNSDVIGHIVEGPDGSVYQYALPDSGLDSPFVGHLTDITLFDNTVAHAFHGKTEMISRRSCHLSIQVDDETPVEYTIRPFSPRENRSINFDDRPVERAKDTDVARRKFQRTPVRQKGGNWMEIVSADISKRNEMRRTPTQNHIMGKHHMEEAVEAAQRARQQLRPEEDSATIPASVAGCSRSAKEEMTDCLEDNRAFFSDDMNQIIQAGIDAPFYVKDASDPSLFSKEKQSRHEWLHCEGNSLTPLNRNPQRADNLGAAETRYNNWMMTNGERQLQFFALHVPGSRNKIKPRFEMLLDTQAINHIELLALIQISNIKILIHNHLDTFQRDPQDVKPSDLATSVGILFSLIQNMPFLSRQAVRQATFKPSVHRFLGTLPPTDDDSDAAAAVSTTTASSAPARALFRT